MSGQSIGPAGGRDVAAFLDRVRQTPQPAGGAPGRLIFALDATASREASWDRAARVQGEMFLEAGRQGGLEVQLVYYRGFDECRASRWVADTMALVRLMTGVQCRAGRTQIRRVLRHALKETGERRVHALVLVGDCVEEDEAELYALAGEMGLAGLRAFLFREGGDPAAERVFARIADLTRGATCAFDSGSPEQLRRLLGAVAAYAAGGSAALRRLAQRDGGPAALLAGRIG